MAQLAQCDWFIIVQCKSLANCAHFIYFNFSLESESFEKFKEFKNEVQNQLGKNIKIL